MRRPSSVTPVVRRDAAEEGLAGPPVEPIVSRELLTPAPAQYTTGARRSPHRADLAYGQRVTLERDLAGGRALAALLADVAALVAAQGQPQRTVRLWAASQRQVEQPTW